MQLDHPCITVSKAARALGLHRRTLLRALERDGVRVIRLTERNTMVSREALTDWVAARRASQG